MGLEAVVQPVIDHHPCRSRAERDGRLFRGTVRDSRERARPRRGNRRRFRRCARCGANRAEVWLEDARDRVDRFEDREMKDAEDVLLRDRILAGCGGGGQCDGIPLQDWVGPLQDQFGPALEPGRASCAIAAAGPTITITANTMSRWVRLSASQNVQRAARAGFRARREPDRAVAGCDETRPPDRSGKRLSPGGRDHRHRGGRFDPRR